MRERYHAHLKNEIMNSNQGDHVTLFEHGVKASKALNLRSRAN